MSTLSIAPSPRQEVDLLCEWLGSVSATARILGKDARTIRGWVNTPQKMQRRSATLVHAAAQVVDRMARSGYDPTQLEHVLVMPWPALKGQPPVELIQAGRAHEVLEVLPQPSVAAAVAVQPWRLELENELDVSLAARLGGGGPLHEAFLFLRALSDAEAKAFGYVARDALKGSPDEETFDAFLAPYWARLAASPPDRPAPAVIELHPDDAGADDDFNIDDLLIVDGGMTSSRLRKN